MKVLFVASGNSVQEAGIVVRNQANALIKNGIDINIFTIHGKGIYGYLSNVPRLKKHLRTNRYDIIHAHYSNCLIISYLARRTEKLGVSFMGTDVLEHYSLLQKLIFIISRRIAMKRCEFVIVKTSEMYKALNIPEARILPNGVNLEIFSPIDKKTSRDILKIDENIKLIIFVSDPARKEKNFELASKAIIKLRSARNDIEFTAIYDKAPEILNYYYNAADLLLLTSSHEGSVNVIKEAMACNCPIVSTDVGDVREIMSGTEGCYLSGNSIDELAEKIQMALIFNKRTDGRSKIFEFCRDSDSVTSTLISIYKNQCAESVV